MTRPTAARVTLRQLDVFNQQMLELYKRLPFAHRLIKGSWMAAQALASASIGYGLGLLLHTQQAFWAALTAIAVTQATYVDTRASSRDQVIGAIIGGTVAMIAAYIAQDNYPVYAVAIVVVIILCWLLNVGSAGKLGGSTATIVLLVPHTGAFWAIALTRLGEVTLGITSALLVTRSASWLEERWFDAPTKSD
jgi:uncharacterized membrane protein YccC